MLLGYPHSSTLIYGLPVALTLHAYSRHVMSYTLHMVA